MGKKFRCCITGSANLTLECAETLFEAGHQIVLIVSNKKSIIRWAEEHNILFFSSFDHLESTSSPLPTFDYLFSIINGKILKPSTLKLPRKLAINYHNSPLPKYAGVHATSWAILNNEKTHGMTWHVMTEQIDGGDILKQETFPIGAEDTAFDLNVICHKLAIKTLRELIDQIETNTINIQKQDLSLRTYFSEQLKAQGGGLICWNKNAISIKRIFRAHTLGSIVNSFGLPKFQIRNEFLIPLNLEVLDEISNASPGTVLQDNTGGLRVATLTNDIRINKVSDPMGVVFTAPHLMQKLQLAIGDKLPVASETLILKLGLILSEASSSEVFCVNAICNSENTNLPIKPKHLRTNSYYYELPLPLKLQHSFLERFGYQYCLSRFVLTSVLLYLHRYSSFSRVSVQFFTSTMQRRVDKVECFVGKSLPLTLQFYDDWSFEQILDASAQAIATIEKHGVFALDLLLRRKAIDKLPPKPKISIMITDQIDIDKHKVIPIPLSILIDSKGTRFCLCSVPGDTNRIAYNDSELKQIALYILQTMQGI